MKKIRRTPYLFAVIFILLIISPVVLFNYYNFLLRPLSTSPSQVKSFVIAPGQPLIQIATNLKKENLIRSPLAFRLLVAQMGISRTIQAGDYSLSAGMSSKQIAIELTHGAQDVWVTLPEGLRVEEQAEIIEKKLKFGTNDKYQFNKKQYLQMAKEGYMFPDTYLIPRDATASDVVERLENTFKQKVSTALLSRAQSYNLSPEEVIVLASVIEKEAKTSQEKPTIAGILLNRINAGLPLQVDATVSYAKGYDTAQNTWWPQVTIEDYQNVNSPFNTYLHLGLPPAPISSPGLDSISAAVNPQPTDYYYYLHDSSGQIHYAKTAQEHEQNIKNFLN